MDAFLEECRAAETKVTEQLQETAMEWAGEALFGSCNEAILRMARDEYKKLILEIAKQRKAEEEAQKRHEEKIQAAFDRAAMMSPQEVVTAAIRDAVKGKGNGSINVKRVVSGLGDMDGIEMYMDDLNDQTPKRRFSKTELAARKVERPKNGGSPGDGRGKAKGKPKNAQLQHARSEPKGKGKGKAVGKSKGHNPAQAKGTKGQAKSAGKGKRPEATPEKGKGKGKAKGKHMGKGTATWSKPGASGRGGWTSAAGPREARRTS